MRNAGGALIASGALLSIGSLALANPFLAVAGAGTLFFGAVAYLEFRSLADRPASAERTLSVRKAPAGEPVACKLRVDAGNRLPLSFQETLPPGAGIVAGHAGGEGVGSAEAAYSLAFSQRGLQQIGPATLEERDGAGLFSLAKCAGEADSVLVYPSLSGVKRYDAGMRRRPARQLEGVRRIAVQGDGTDFSSLRKYAPGDELRRVDWKATARTRQLIVKTFEEEKRQRVFIALDCGKQMDAGKPVTMLDAGVDASVLLANAVLRRGDLLGFASFSDRMGAFLKPGSGRAQLYAVLDAIARAKPERETDFLASFQRLSALLPQRSLLFIFSCLRDGEPDRILEAIRLLKSHQHAVIVIAPFEPLFEEVDGDDITRAIAGGAREKYARDLNSLASRAGRFGARVSPVGPADASDEALRRYAYAVNRGLATI